MWDVVEKKINVGVIGKRKGKYVVALSRLGSGVERLEGRSWRA